MANLNFRKVNAVPTTWDADTFYFVPSTGPAGGLFAESYLTDSTGAPRMIGNTVMIQELIAAANEVELQFVTDIPARDALTLTLNSLVLVGDASSDATVDSGAAMYFWDNTGGTFIKVTEFESLDVVVDWTDIQNGPTSTPAQIDQAVADSHTHANLAVLDAITDAGSGLVITDAERTQISTNATDIAALQADSHTHANLVELDKIGEDADGCLTYDGVAYSKWASLEW